MTTTASASSPTRTCRCPYAVAPSPGPLITISIGSPTWVSLPTVTIVAVLNDEKAWAATRSAGTPPWPSRSSPRWEFSTVTPSGAVTSMRAAPVAGAEPSCRPRSRRKGVKRQISSRPRGTSKASTSNDVKISPLVLPSSVSARFCAPLFSRRFARPGFSRRFARPGYFPSLRSPRSADRAFHLQLDQPIELERVFHRKFLVDRLHEARHHHGHRLVLGQAAAHQIEQLIRADLGHGGLVAHRHVVLPDVDVGVGVAAADRIDQQRIAFPARSRSVR